MVLGDIHCELYSYPGEIHSDDFEEREDFGDLTGHSGLDR
jgi:hypothetical protein